MVLRLRTGRLCLTSIPRAREVMLRVARGDSPSQREPVGTSAA